MQPALLFPGQVVGKGDFHDLAGMFEIQQAAVTGLPGKLQQAILTTTQNASPVSIEQSTAGHALQIPEEQRKGDVHRADIRLGAVFFSTPFQVAGMSPGAVNVLGNGLQGCGAVTIRTPLRKKLLHVLSEQPFTWDQLQYL